MIASRGSYEMNAAQIADQSLRKMLGLQDGKVEEIENLLNSRKNLPRLLRSHLLDPIDSEALVGFRDDVDNLLMYYSLLEIGAAVGVFREVPRESSVREALNIDAVKVYYEDLYPLLLPSALRLRLSGAPVLDVRSKFGETGYSELIMLQYQLQDRNVDFFLSLLDDFPMGGITLESLIQSISSPPKLLQYLFDVERENTPTARGAHGLVRFLRFSLSWEALLARQEDLELQSMLFQLHSYWFEQCSGLVYGALATVITGLKSAARTPEALLEADLGETEQVITSMAEGLLALRRLTSSVYRFRYEEMCLRALATPPAELEEQIESRPNLGA